jgi:hypothetical protein
MAMFNVIDHDQCPVPYSVPLATYQGDSAGELPDDFVPYWLKCRVEDPDALLAAVDLAERFDLSRLREICGTIPEHDFVPHDVRPIIDGLSWRQSRLRSWVGELNESNRLLRGSRQ